MIFENKKFAVRPLMVITLLTLIFTSCKKVNKVETGETPLVYTNYPPAAKPDCAVDSSNSGARITKFGSLSQNLSTIDFDGDQLPDIRFVVTNSVYPNGSKDYETRIETMGPGAFVLSDSVYSEYNYDQCLSTAKNSATNALYPKALSYKDSLKQKDRWRQGSIHLTSYHETWQTPPAPLCYHSSKSLSWPDNEWKYIGVRVKERFGWIKMKSDLNRTNTFYEFAWMP